MRRSPRQMVAALATFALISGLGVVGGAAPASADATAATDDASVSVPTGNWIYSNVSTATVSNLLSTNGARLTDIKPYSVSAGTWTVSMVKNSGAYAVPGWWWYVGVTATDISAALTNNNARLIDAVGYDVSGSIRYAVVMVSNTGASARGWTWLVGATSTDIGNNITNNNQRLISLDSYLVGGATRYIAAFVTNSGSDAKAWQWWIGQTAANVTAKVNSFGGRIVEMEKMPNGTFAFVMVKNTGADNKYWRYHFGLSLTQVLDVLTQYGTRVIDIDVSVGRSVTYNLVAIDNSTAESRRLNNIIAASLTKSNGLPAAEYGYYLRQLGITAPTTDLQGAVKFEPASAIKAVHNLAVMRKVKAGTDSLSASNFAYYNYPSSPQTTGNECPNPVEETAANRVLTTVDNGRQLMMSNSDNRTTRGVTLRYGLTYIRQSASVVGMTNTTIDQDLVGCGFQGGKRNQTTLQDLSKLYSGVESGSLLSSTQRASFYTGMNGQAFNGSNDLETKVAAIVQQEATSLGKSSATANSVLSQMNWQFKPGGYGIACGNPFTTCTSGFHSIGTIAGIVRLPFKSGTTTTMRPYLFGTFIDGINTNCSGCMSYPSSQEDTLRAELLRPVIRAALKTH